MDKNERERAGQDILDRLKRIEGQVRGIQNMVRQQKDCEKVLAQVKAARQALAAVSTQMVKHHLAGCVADGDSPEDVAAGLSRAMDIISRFVRD